MLGVHSLPMIPALALLAGFASTAASPLGRRRLALLGVALAGLIFEPRADFRVAAARGRVTDGVLMPEDPVTSRTATAGNDGQ